MQDLLAVCLCAAWCHLCGSYRATFERVGEKWPDARFRWLDIEDEAELLGSLDIEDFPTLLVIKQGKPWFFGPIEPHEATLDRLLRSVRDDPGDPPSMSAELAGLSRKLHAETASANRVSPQRA